MITHSPIIHFCCDRLIFLADRAEKSIANFRTGVIPHKFFFFSLGDAFSPLTALFASLLTILLPAWIWLISNSRLSFSIPQLVLTFL